LKRLTQTLESLRDSEIHAKRRRRRGFGDGSGARARSEAAGITDDDGGGDFTKLGHRGGSGEVWKRIENRP